MPLKLPEADTTIIQDKKNIVQDLFKITKNIIHSDEELNLMKLMVCLSTDKNLSQ